MCSLLKAKYADIGTLQRLPKVIGNSSKVRELVYTGRSFNSQEANEMGLVSRVVPGGLKDVQSMPHSSGVWTADIRQMKRSKWLN